MFVHNLIEWQRVRGNGAPPGYSMKAVKVITLTAGGKVSAVEDTEALVPFEPIRSGRKILANVLVDKPEYVFGPRWDNTIGGVAEKHAMYMQQLDALEQRGFNLAAVKRYIRSGALPKMKASEWIVFKVAGKQVQLLPGIADAIYDLKFGADQKIRCQITGEPGHHMAKHPRISFLGTKLISTNTSAAWSWGQDSATSTWLTVRSVTDYVNALDTVVRSEPNRVCFGSGDDMIAVLWFGSGPHAAQLEQAIKAMFMEGRVPHDLQVTDDPFTVACLGKHNGRLVLKWHLEATEQDVLSNMLQHHEETLVEGDEMDVPKPYAIEYALRPKGTPSSERMTAYMASILMGVPYCPLLTTLVQQRCVMPRTTDRGQGRYELPFVLLRALLAVRRRNNKENIPMALDLATASSGYLCGCILAVVDKMQEDCIDGVKSKIRDRFMGGMLRQPQHHIARLMVLANAYLAKMRRQRRHGSAVYWERILNAHMDKLQDIPAALSKREQAQAVLGFNHQRTDFFRKKGMRVTDSLIPQNEETGEQA